jgi:hypothetical protein
MSLEGPSRDEILTPLSWPGWPANVPHGTSGEPCLR